MKLDTEGKYCQYKFRVECYKKQNAGGSGRRFEEVAVFVQRKSKSEITQPHRHQPIHAPTDQQGYDTLTIPLSMNSLILNIVTDSLLLPKSSQN